MTITSDINTRSRQIFAEQLNLSHQRTDRIFAVLLVLQWLAAIVVAMWVSPRTWLGSTSETHIHVWAATVLGAIVTSLPVLLVWIRPGTWLTRHTVAAAQMCWSALLIHLTGGRIETHFHVFGSLAMLAFYRDWKVMATATVVVAADHFLRGIFWPLSVYGVATGQEWRFLEHAWWVAFEDAFLLVANRVSLKQLAEFSNQQANLEQQHDIIEAEVEARTHDLRVANAELAASQEELSRLYNDATRHSEALCEARDAAQAASRVKSDFLANMSHEIRTPMTAILGFADILLKEGKIEAAPPSRIEAIRTIQRNGDHLLTIINDILDLSKIEAGMLQVERTATSPVQAVFEVLSLMEVRAIDKGIKLMPIWNGPIPAMIEGDPVRLRQILLNLVGNAIKFTHTGHVSISVSFEQEPLDDPRLRFEVTDTGIGMTEEQTSRLFQAFSQGDTSTTREYGGTGLGLIISKRFAELMGGDISIHSTYGAGSTFVVTIATGPLEGVPLIDPKLEMANAIVESQQPRPVEQSLILPLAGCRILLAEDCIDNQRLISVVVKKAGADVVIVENGRLAIEELTVDGTVDGQLVEPPPFDIVLSDMQMPVMDGYTAAGILQAKGNSVPVIALTAHAMSGECEKCIAAGCDDYATKPINREKLIRQLAKWHGQLKSPADRAEKLSKA